MRLQLDASGDENSHCLLWPHLWTPARHMSEMDGPGW